MTEFDDLFGELGAPLLLATHGEKVIYRPLGRRPRTIEAIVDRQPPEVLGEVSRGVAQFMAIDVLNDSVHGISSREIDRGGDLIEVSPIKGQPAERRPIFQILDQTAGMLRLEVR